MNATFLPTYCPICVISAIAVLFCSLNFVFLVICTGEGTNALWRRSPQEKEVLATQLSTSAWAAERLQKGLRSEYSSSISEHGHLPVPYVMEAIITRTISLLTADVKTLNCIAVNREMMEEALNSLNIGAKVLDRRSNAM